MYWRFYRYYSRVAVLLVLTSLCFARNVGAVNIKKVVSLVPAATEVFEKLELTDVIVGITVHDLKAGMHGKKVVGSFFAPDVKAIKRLHPDLVIISAIHEELKPQLARFAEVEAFDVQSLEGLYNFIRHVGKLFGRQSRAENLINEISAQIDLISKKVSRIPAVKKKRVLRFMGRGTSSTVYVPAGKSFQNDIIKLAGGIPLRIGDGKGVVPITVEEWKRFNPQVVYGCGEDRQVAEKFFSRPGWKDVDAIRNGEVYYFPCSLTCRLSPNTGLFVEWLSSVIYDDEFAKPQNLVLEEKITGRKDVNINLGYVKQASIIDSLIFDFPHKTLEINFSKPMDIISTLEGPRNGIRIVGNSYSPPPCWKMGHKIGFRRMREHTYNVLGLSPSTTSLLFTGADMDNLSIKKRSYGTLVVYALVTAGVRGNALRTSMDEGRYIEPGTINIILMTSRKLSPRAMARAIITATEAKTAALQDLDIRSTQDPRDWQATGTGTDEIIVVSGDGSPADVAGGHSKLGQLIAEAVYAGVKEAISRQNRLVAPRSVFERLEERRIELYNLISGCGCYKASGKKRKILKDLQMLLADPSYASYIEMAFALSDAYKHNLISDLGPFEDLCVRLTSKLAGRTINRDELIDYMTSDQSVPAPLKMMINAFLNGVALREAQ